MEVILLKKVENLGNLGDKVRVKAGYGRNYLIPQGKAAPATTANLAAFEARRAQLEQEAAEALKVAEERRAALEQIAVKISAKAGSEGKLFGSVGTIDIADAITAAGVAVERKEVRLPEGSIRATGEHKVDIHLHTDVNTSITITVVGEE